MIFYIKDDSIIPITEKIKEIKRDDRYIIFSFHNSEEVKFDYYNTSESIKAYNFIIDKLKNYSPNYVFSA